MAAENRFVVLSLLEDLMFSQYDDRSDEEPLKLRKARCRAIAHMPILMERTEARWSHAEVVPYLVRCLQEEDKDLSIAVASILPFILRDGGAALQSTSKKQPPREFIGVSDVLPLLFLLGGSGSTEVRHFAVNYSFPYCLLGSPFEYLESACYHSPQFDLEDTFSSQILNAKRKQISDQADRFWATIPDSSVATERLLTVVSFMEQLVEAQYPAHRASGAHFLILCLFNVNQKGSFLLQKFRSHEIQILESLLAKYLEASQRVRIKDDHMVVSNELLRNCHLLRYRFSRQELFHLMQEHIRTSPILRNFHPVAENAMLGFTRLLSLPELEASDQEDLGGMEYVQMWVNVCGVLHQRQLWKVRFHCVNHISGVFEGVCGHVLTLKHVVERRDILFQLVREVAVLCRNMCGDCEDENRIISAQKFGSLCIVLRDSAIMSSCNATVWMEPLLTLVQELLDCVQVMTMDGAEKVRSAASISLADTSRSLFEIDTYIESIEMKHMVAPRISGLRTTATAILMDLINDESPLVQLSVISKLGETMTSLGHEAVENELLSLCSKLVALDRWRVRHAFVGVLARLCYQFLSEEAGKSLEPEQNRASNRGTSRQSSREREESLEHTRKYLKQFAKQSLLPVLVDTLFDRAKAVRDEALEVTIELCNSFSQSGETTDTRDSRTSFVETVLWPLITGHPRAEVGYLSRMQLLQIAVGLNVSKRDVFFPMIRRYAADDVVNVKMAVGKAVLEVLKVKESSAAVARTVPLSVSDVQVKNGNKSTTRSFMAFTNQEKLEELLPMLRALVQDPCEDVREIASRGVAICF